MGDDLGTREEETDPVAASASVWIADRLVRPFCLPSIAPISLLNCKNKGNQTYFSVIFGGLNNF